MEKTGWGACLLGALVVSAVTPAWAMSMLEASCETAVKARLLRPASFELITSSETQKLYTLDAFTRLMEAQGTPIDAGELERLHSAGAKPVRYSMNLAYNVKNQAGELVADVSFCDFVSPTGEPSSAARPERVSVDGETMAQWDARHSIPR